MPSLNFSSPGLPGLAAGLFPVASNQLPQIAVGAGGDFAAIMTPPDGAAAPTTAGFLDIAPALPSGTGLPPERQDIAVPLQPLPPVPVEDVMVGTVPPPAAGDDAVPAGPAGPAVLPDQAPAAPAPQLEIGECRIETWDFHGASLRALARGAAQPGKPQPVIMPDGATPDLVEPVTLDVPQPVIADEEVEPNKPRQAAPNAPLSLPQPAPPPFAPIDWTRPPAPVPSPASESSVEDTSAPLPCPASAATPVNGTAKPGPETISTLPPQPGDQPAGQQARILPQLQSQPQPQPQPHQHAAAPLPQGFNLPPEMARQVAEIVRAAVSDRDDPVPASDSAEPLSAMPPLQSAIGPSAPLHRDFVPAHRPVIDTSRAEWMQAMIERIAEMPQADGKREAQIRLSPDALGTVDVRIEQRQDRLHVTMNAETAQARQLLSEAAPRLHELAEARGLKLSQTGIGGGESHDRRQTPEQQEQTVPLRPRPAETGTDSSSETPGDLIA